jgi:glycerate 2-kinase
LTNRSRGIKLKLMPIIQNFKSLATTPKREIVLKVIEAGLSSIQPQKILKTEFILNGSDLQVQDKHFDLKNFNRVFLIGFGKGSGGISKIIEDSLKDFLTEGFVIDNFPQKFSKINFTLGSHPLPSEQNLEFTENVLSKITNLTDKDLVLVVICGGGSAMFEAPFKISLDTLIKISHALLRSGATISEMNVIRKHLSKVKGGQLAKHLYPATVASLIFSDVPGNDLSTIASGPTVMDETTFNDALEIIKKYDIQKNLDIPENSFTELPKEEKYFSNVYNNIIVSNKTALSAMKDKAKLLGFETDLYSDRLQGDAKQIGEQLIQVAKDNRMLIAGGETTLKVAGKGKGGRNQTLVLGALPFIDEKTVIASFDSDGVDYFHFAGAIGDGQTLKKAQKLKLDQQKYLSDDNSYEFFQKTEDGIFTDKLGSNVSDLMVVLKADV